LRKYDDWWITNLHVCRFRSDANRLEIEEIEKHKSISPNGYNLTSGGDANKPSEETRKKLVDSHRNPSAETRAKLSAAHTGVKNHNYGKEMHVKTRAALLAANIGRKLTDEHKVKIGISSKQRWSSIAAKLLAANIGRKPSVKKRAKLSAAANNMSDIHRTRLSDAGKNRAPISDITRNKIKIAQAKRRYKEYQQKIQELEDTK